MENNEDRIITPTMISCEVKDNCAYWDRTFTDDDIQKIADAADSILINDSRYLDALVNAMDTAINQFGAEAR